MIEFKHSIGDSVMYLDNYGNISKGKIKTFVQSDNSEKYGILSEDNKLNIVSGDRISCCV